MTPQPISERAFHHIRTLFAHESGIRLSQAKQGLVASRLQGRLRQLGLDDIDAYCALIADDEAGEERGVMVDLLTTHETYFFREPRHFEHLAATVLPALRDKPVRVWCAAASTGEEVWSTAMTLASTSINSSWEVLGTDISEQSLVTAERGLYRMERLQHMPAGALKQFCLRGKNDFAGSLLINGGLRERVDFCRHNLLESPHQLGKFDVIFLRNVLIYFERDMRQKIVERALEALNPGGWLYTGHADSVLDLTLPMETIAPAIHRKPLSRVAAATKRPNPSPVLYRANANANAF